MSHGSSHVWPQAQITPAQVIPFESHLILALGYKLLEIMSHHELEMGPCLADP